MKIQREDYKITVLFYIFISVRGVVSLQLKEIDFLTSPIPCSEETDILILVHSAVPNQQKRSAIRSTWGFNSNNFRTVFLLGTSEEIETSDNFHDDMEIQNDIIVGDFVDSYRNMSIKHLLGYRWTLENCANVKHVIKCDDDIFLDTFHIRSFLANLILESPYYLCQTVRRKPDRVISSKWFVDNLEYPDEEYPLYCSGSSYVTDVQTIKLILSEASDTSDYFWIDDTFVTGIVPRRLIKKKININYYDWANSCLNHHEQLREDLLTGTLFSPELISAFDLKENQIRNLYKKAEKCMKTGCYEQFYADTKQFAQELKPKKIQAIEQRRSEL